MKSSIDSLARLLIQTNEYPPRRAISLTRVSTTQQEDNTSHAVQREANERAGKSEGWEIVATLEETVSGALYTSREETQLALQMLANDEADILLVYDMSRYGRDVEYQQKFLKRITKHGKQLQFATMRLEYDEYSGWLTPESEQYFNMMGGGSSAERAHIKRRLRNGKLKKVSQGITPSRTKPPYGYHIVTKADVIRGTFAPADEGRFFVVEDKIHNAPAMFEQYDQTESLRQVCRFLQDNGVLTPTGKKLWQPSSLKYILKNPVYVGRPAWGRHRYLIDEDRRESGRKSGYSVKTSEDKWQFLSAPAVISEELFASVQKKLETGRAERSGRTDRKYMLTGLLICAGCGGRMSGRISRSSKQRAKGTETRQYRCNQRSSVLIASDAQCKQKPANAARLETLVLEAVTRLLQEPEIIAAASTKAKARKAVAKKPDDTNALHAELATLERRERATIESRIEARMMNQATEIYDGMLKDVNARRLEIKKRLSTLELGKSQTGAPVFVMKDKEVRTIIRALHAEVSDLEKNKILCNFLKSIQAEENSAILTLNTTPEISLLATPSATTASSISLKIRR